MFAPIQLQRMNKFQRRDNKMLGYVYRHNAHSCVSASCHKHRALK